MRGPALRGLRVPGRASHLTSCADGPFSPPLVCSLSLFGWCAAGLCCSYHHCMSMSDQIWHIHTAWSSEYQRSIIRNMTTTGTRLGSVEAIILERQKRTRIYQTLTRKQNSNQEAYEHQYQFFSFPSMTSRSQHPTLEWGCGGMVFLTAMKGQNTPVVNHQLQPKSYNTTTQIFNYNLI